MQVITAAGDIDEQARVPTSPARYQAIRALTTKLCTPLVTEDYVIQSMEDVSPTKWHLAHTTWFFETFVLKEFASRYREYHEDFAYLFNSYYVQAGERHCRPKRGLLSRPTVEQVYAYRDFVDRHMIDLLSETGNLNPELVRRVEIGLNHEQQHQELILTDIKHVLSENPLHPVYADGSVAGHTALAPDMSWIGYEGGMVEIGHIGHGFSYDNEGPAHKCFLEPFELGSRLVTNREYLEFIRDGGYEAQSLWLSEGWAALTAGRWKAPGYWQQRDGQWWSFTLRGFRPVIPDEPVCHVSYFEADAYTRWREARLPTEFEWETAVTEVPIRGNFLDDEHYHPAPVVPGDGLLQAFGDVWEWTRSHYSPYPRYAPEPGALGEYNGKFMCNQFVLRGGSVATSRAHIRKTYRNFFPPGARWQFSGIRLAQI